MGLLDHFFLNAEWYAIGLVWIVIPLAGLSAYLRLTHTVRRLDEDTDGLS